MEIRTNPDREFVREMKKAIKNNNGFCPEALEKTKDSKCMCRDFREMEHGTCACGLYTKP